MEFDRYKARQKSAPTSDNDSKYYFSDAGDIGRQKVAKQLRRRKNSDENVAKEERKGRSVSSEQRLPKFKNYGEKDRKKFNEARVHQGAASRILVAT
ncbi:hypothetical protein JTE90_024474 [Oedothorax gibbosus]|uniref:Uncharacterized protein n=1 Tax=Oedothorax gibbosus TaxID=931172 RepID=A0AAV6UID5_9ARAC|nr:hypothetical protein JTE90_024474 [Oedothorax gibbosus]